MVFEHGGADPGNWDERVLANGFHGGHAAGVMGISTFSSLRPHCSPVEKPGVVIVKLFFSYESTIGTVAADPKDDIPAFDGRSANAWPPRH